MFDNTEVTGGLEEDNFSGVDKAGSLIGEGSGKTRRRESGDSKLRLISF